MIEFILLTTVLAACDDRAVPAKAGSDWWSFRPIERSTVPGLSSDWIRTPVDSFVLAKMLEKGLTPSPEADARTLVRRITYDLHGLPPTPQEIEEFISDARPDA